MFAVYVATLVTSAFLVIIGFVANSSGGLSKLGMSVFTVALFGLVWSITSLVTGVY